MLDLLASQPIRRVRDAGTEFVLLGTAHVSAASAQAVSALLQREEFDAVAVELCAPRADAIHNPERVAEMDLFRILREGRVAAVAAGLALGAYQRRLAKQLGIEPGAEMKTAMEGARTRGLPCWLVDRAVAVTLRRARAAVGFWQRMRITAGMVAGLLDDGDVSEQDVERLKQGDILESTFTEFARSSPPLYQALIAERDRYMVARLRAQAAAEKPGKVLVVVGAGHLEGMLRAFQQHEPPDRALAELDAEPKPSRLGHAVGLALIALVLGGFVWAFARGLPVGIEVLQMWVLYTGTLGALGALLAGAHPLSIVAAFVASPITPLHPALASGMVSGAVELAVRKPKVLDFQSLREDLNGWRGWWRNRVARVFLVFMLTNLGTGVGVWVAASRAISVLAR